MAGESSRQRWERATLARSLASVPERPELSAPGRLARLYTPDDVSTLDHDRDCGYPGAPPFVRGVQPTMYRARFWTMRQYAGFSTAVETNRRFKYLLDAGQTGLSTAFDLPTQIGLDSDDPLAAGEVGRVGVSINSLADMDELFADIPLGEVSTSMTINSTAIVLLGMYVALARQRGVPMDRVSGTLQNDVLKEYISRGTYAFPIQPSLRLVTDIFGFCVENLPKWNPISISGYHIREAGATAAQELAFTFADAITYVEEARAAGIDLTRLAPRLSFFFNVHNNFLEEIAKFRAARRLWCHIARDRFGLADPGCQKLRFHAQTAGSTLTAQEPDNNVARVAIQALAAVLGGAQSLHTNSRDEALGLPTEASAQIALRTQQILAYESGAADTIDAMAGSYAVETLTAGLEQQVLKYLETIDRMGGMKAAIQAGYVQREIQDSAWQAQQAIESGQQVIVGVNRFVSPAPAEIPIQRIDPEIEARQKARLAALRSSRSASAASESLALIEACARGTENLVAPIVEAVERNVTLGEIMTALRRVFGEHVEEKVF